MDNERNDREDHASRDSREAEGKIPSPYAEATFAACIEALRPFFDLISDLVADRSIDEHEVEVRFGHWDAARSRFEASVDRDFFDNVSARLDAVGLRGNCCGPLQSRDYFYPDATGRQVRTTVVPDEEDVVLKRKHVRKTTVWSRVFQFTTLGTDTRKRGRGGAATAKRWRTVDDSLNAGFDIRVSVNREEPVSDSDEALPDIVEPNHVRIKQRKSWAYEGTALGSLLDELIPVRDGNPYVWRYDATVVWSGRNESEAETAQNKSADPVYEVELECLDPEAYQRVYADCPDMFLYTLLVKAGDLVQTHLGDIPHWWEPAQV